MYYLTIQIYSTKVRWVIIVVIFGFPFSFLHVNDRADMNVDVCINSVVK